MIFDPTINVGNVATLLVIIVSALGFYWQTLRDFKGFKDDIVEIKTDIKVLNRVIIDMALQTERMNVFTKRMDRMESKVDELSHGKGFIDP